MVLCSGQLQRHNTEDLPKRRPEQLCRSLRGITAINGGSISRMRRQRQILQRHHRRSQDFRCGQRCQLDQDLLQQLERSFVIHHRWSAARKPANTNSRILLNSHSDSRHADCDHDGPRSQTTWKNARQAMATAAKVIAKAINFVFNGSPTNHHQPFTI